MSRGGAQIPIEEIKNKKKVLTSKGKDVIINVSNEREVIKNERKDFRNY